MPRFAALGVVANAQPLWACHEAQMDVLTIPFLGPGASDVAVPVRVAAAVRRAPRDGLRLVRLDARPARRDGGRGHPRDPAPADPRPGDRSCRPSGSRSSEAIRGFTLGSAYVNHLDDDTGSIEVGKLADLAVVDRDLFAPDAGPIGDARVLATFVGGAAVFEDPALG